MANYSRGSYNRNRDFSNRNNNESYRSKNDYSYNDFRNSHEQRNDVDQECFDWLEFYVPSSSLGLIIGKRGSRVRELQDETGTRISVKSEERNENDEALVVVEGNMANCEDAKSLILEISSQKGYSSNQNRRPRRPEYRNQPEINNDNYRYDDIMAPPQKEVVNNEKPKGFRNVYEEYLMQEKLRWSGTAKVIKDFYVEDSKVAAMPKDEVDAIRKSNQNIVVESLAGQTEKDDRDPDPIVVDPDNDPTPNPVRTFEEAFGRYPEIMTEIKTAGFETPSPIQMQAWPIILKGRDLIGIAQTGTGKTLAFLLPALIHIEGQTVPRSQRTGPTVLIITPTRELALQIEQEVNKYKYRGIKCICIYGGGNRRGQIDAVSEGVEIVVATPGRLNDLISNNYLKMEYVSYVVLDEADRMLDLGFQPDIYKALYEVRPGRQTIMTTATWPNDVRKLAFKYMRDPFQVFVGTLDLTAVHSVEQRVVMMDNSEKYEMLKKFLEEELVGDTKVIIFMTRKATVDHVASNLAVFGNIFCASITGDRDQMDREAAIDDIKTGHAKALIATDIASRGIDIKDVTHVINYDFPKNIEEYVHRIGRTGRAGRTGISITYFTRDDWRHASELIRIMEEAGHAVPEELYKMSQRYEEKKTRDDDGGRKRRGRGRY